MKEVFVVVRRGTRQLPKFLDVAKNRENANRLGKAEFGKRFTLYQATVSDLAWAVWPENQGFATSYQVGTLQEAWEKGERACIHRDGVYRLVSLDAPRVREEQQ